MKIRSESALMSDNTSNAMVEDSRKILLKSGFSASEAEMFIQKLVSVLDDYADCLGEGVKVKYLIWKGIVNMEFRVLIPGEAFDPFMEGDGAQERSFEKMFSLNLSAGNSRLTYRYTKKCNCISLSIPLSEKSKKIIKDPVVWGVILGFLCGFICSLLPQETRSFVTDSMATPLLNIILTVISGVMGPVIFFSLVSSTIALAGINDLTNLGFKIIRRFILIILFLIVVSILISGLIFQNFGTGGSGFLWTNCLS